MAHIPNPAHIDIVTSHLRRAHDIPDDYSGIHEDDIRTAITHFELERKLHDMVRVDNDSLLDYLYVRTIGKRIDRNYLAYCGKLCEEYFRERGVTSVRTQARMLREIHQLHLDQRRKSTRPTLLDIQEDALVNVSTEHATITRSWWHPWRKEKISVETALDSLNEEVDVNGQNSPGFINWNAVATITTGAVIVGLAVKYATSSPSQTMVSTTIQAAVKPLGQLTSTGIPQLASPNTISALTRDYTAGSAHSLWRVTLGHMINSLSRSMIRLNERIIPPN